MVNRAPTLQISLLKGSSDLLCVGPDVIPVDLAEAGVISAECHVIRVWDPYIEILSACASLSILLA